MDFAEAVEERVPAARIVSNLEMAAQEGEGPEHVWLVHEGRHYDSETPEGVDDWRDLPFFQRNFTAGQMAGWELGEGIEKARLVRDNT